MDFVFFAVIIVVIILSGVYTVVQQTASVIVRFNKIKKVSNSGLNIKIPLVDRIAGSNTILLTHGPTGMQYVSEKLHSAMITGKEITLYQNIKTRLNNKAS